MDFAKIQLLRFKIRSWSKRVNKWSISQWKEYHREMYDKFKNTHWTKSYLGDLPDFYELYKVVTPEYISSPPDYPAVLSWKSSGTKEPKDISLSRLDAFLALRTLGRISYNVNKFPARNLLGLVTSEPYASAKFISADARIIGKKHYAVKVFELIDELPLIKRSAPYDALFGMLSLCILCS